MSLDSCQRCDGFMPLLARSCPHCGAQRSVLARRLLAASAGGAVAMTLMACYGGPPKPEPNAEPASPEPSAAASSAPASSADQQ